MQTNDVSQSLCEACSDDLLTQRTLAGDEDAFAVLMRRYRPWLLSFIYHLTHNGADAEDIVQQVFLKLYLALPTLRTDQPLHPWLFQVARNQCLDERRRKRAWYFSEIEAAMGTHEFPELALLLDPHPSPEDIAEQHEMQSLVLHAINALPAKYRAIVLLRYGEQHRFSEIAQILGIPEQTAKTYMHRAKPLLRAALRTQEHGPVLEARHETEDVVAPVSLKRKEKRR